MTAAKYLFASLLVAFGIGFAMAPDAWIETRFGVSPDGGDGWFEALIAAAPIAAGLWLASRAYGRVRAWARHGAT